MNLDTHARLHAEQARHTVIDAQLPPIEQIMGEQTPEPQPLGGRPPDRTGWRRSKWTVGLVTAVGVLVIGAIPILLLISGQGDRIETAASPDQILGKWELVGIDGEPGLLSSNGKVVSVTFSLDPDFAPRTTNAAGETRPREFSFSAFTGCNGGSGRWTMEGDQLLLGGISSTLVGCGPSPFDPGGFALQDQEHRLQGCVLIGVATWAVNGDQLTITKDDVGSLDGCQGDGSLVAVFERPDPEDSEIPGGQTTTTMRERPPNADVVNLPSLSGRPEVPTESRHYQNQEPVGLDAESRDRYERFAPYADQLVFEIQSLGFATGWGVGLDGWGALVVIVPSPEQQALAREILGDEVEISTQPIIAGFG